MASRGHWRHRERGRDTDETSELEIVEAESQEHERLLIPLLLFKSVQSD